MVSSLSLSWSLLFACALGCYLFAWLFACRRRRCLFSLQALSPARRSLYRAASAFACVSSSSLLSQLFFFLLLLLFSLRLSWLVVVVLMSLARSFMCSSGAGWDRFLAQVVYNVVAGPRAIMEAAAAAGFRHVGPGIMELCLLDIGCRKITLTHERAATLIDAYKDQWGWGHVDVVRALRYVLPCCDGPPKLRLGSDGLPPGHDSQPSCSDVYAIAMALGVADTVAAEVNAAPAGLQRASRHSWEICVACCLL